MNSDPLGAATSFDDLLRKIAAIETGRFPETVWRAAAIARTFDAALFRQCAAEPTPLEALASHSFEAFAAHPDVVRIDAKRVRLREIARDRVIRRLADDRSASKAAGGQIYEIVAKSGDALERFAVQLVVEPSAAANRLDQLYIEADGTFDLSGCDALLEIMRERAPLLEPMLRDKLTEKEQYLSSRLLFVDEFYRTVSYFEHGDLLAKFRELVTTSVLSRIRTSRWLLDLHGKGGIGKTMFRRWVVARHCLPASSPLRTPVACVDIDFVYRALLIRQPWLVLLAVATQLRPQLAGAPFSDMMGPEETGLRNLLLDRAPALRVEDERALLEAGEFLQPVLEDRFCLGLGDARAVVIFDTLEELSLHQPAVLASLLEMLERLHQRCPGLRVVLSGRYRVLDPKKPVKGLNDAVWDNLQRACIDLPVEPLTEPESRRFLTEVRRLGSDQPLTEMIAKSAGNPFVLALFADLASERTLTAEEVRDSNVAFAYLIERIIDRIPDEEVLQEDDPDVQRRKHTQRGLRWLLRYAVVPRRLTREFAFEVLSNFVLEELLDKTHRDETSLAPAGPRYADRDRWRRSNIPVAFDDLWAALQSYASSSSWVNGSGDELELQPEIVVPMRQLLTQKIEKYPIWLELHAAAAEYFEHRAEVDGAVGKHLPEALYHRYQAHGAAASEWFDRYLNQCHKADVDPYAAVQALCDSLFGEDYLDADRKPIEHFTGSAIVATETLGTAALESFLASVIEQMERPGTMAESQRAAMASYFATFERYSCTGPRAELARLAAAVRGIDPKPRLEWPDPILTELANPDEQIAAALLTAKRPGLTPEIRRLWHERALAIAEQQSGPRHALQPYFVRAQLALFDAAAGHHESAFKVLCYSLAVALDSNAQTVQVSDLLLQTGDLAFALGHWAELEYLAEKVAALPFPAHEEATSWLIQLALDRFDYSRVETLIRRFNSEIEPARQEFVAELSGATFRFSEAERNYTNARTGYLNLKYASAASLALLNHTRFLLDVVGATQRAEQILNPLAGSRSFPEPLIELQMNLMRIRINARNGDAARARGHLDRILKLLDREKQLPRTYAMAAIAALLAEGAGDASDAANLAEMMAGAPTPARLVALRPFLYAAPGAQLTFDMALPDSTPALATHDRLYLAAAKIFFGQIAAAKAILRPIRGNEYEPELVAVALRLARRIAPDAVETPVDWVSIWAVRGNKAPGLAGIILLEEVERLVATDRIAPARQALAIAKGYLSDLPSDSKWSELFVRLEAATATRSGFGSDLDTELATLPGDRLLRPVSVLTIGLDSSSLVELRFHDAGAPDVVRSAPGGDLMGALAMASTTNDLYPPELAEMFNKGRAAAEGLFGLVWGRLTGFVWESEGTATLRDRIAVSLKDIMGIGPRFGYAWYRGSLAPLRRGLSKSASNQWLKQIFATMLAPAEAAPDSMIAVETATPAVTTVPWELGHAGSQPFFRTQRGVALPDTLLHLRRAIAKLRKSDEPVTADSWDGFVSEMGGPAHFRRTVRERLRPSLGRHVLILRADAETQRRQLSSYGASGLRLEDVYARAGFEVTAWPLDSKAVLSHLDRKRPPGLIHVSARISESFSPREAFLESESGDPMRADLLSQILLYRDDGLLRPLLVLDVADNRFDPGRTLLLRNAFASRLYAQAARGVLAIGPSPPDLLRPTAELLVELLGQEAIGLADLHNAFWANMSHPVAPALFTLDPDLPVWD